ncbi:hypothetical protein ACHFJ0_03750 [Paracoccus sp. NGMCC 1.201697]|uniref:Uncharacterized protein n=1 Tax=Paracoccus broussonetiae subsp. drimophilus TaxID=3373869 RepID=A0ABW7LGK4_9RHOB
MTRKNGDDEQDNPATNPDRENGQGKHDGSAHQPEEFLKSGPQGAKPHAAMGGSRDKKEDC